MWKNFRGYGSDCGWATEGEVSATDGVVSFIEQVITAAERVMSETKTTEDFKMAVSGLGVRRFR